MTIKLISGSIDSKILLVEKDGKAHLIRWYAWQDWEDEAGYHESGSSFEIIDPVNDPHIGPDNSRELLERLVSEFESKGTRTIFTDNV